MSPTGTDNTVTTLEDTNKVFATNDFPFADAGGQTLTRVRIDSLPVTGTLKLNGVAVSAGQIITAADITSGKLAWTPPADNNGAALASFTFSVGDARTFDAAPNTMTINVTPVADITNDAVSTNEDTAITFNVVAGTNGATIDTFEASPSVTAFTSPSNGAVSCCRQRHDHLHASREFLRRRYVHLHGNIGWPHRNGDRDRDRQRRQRRARPRSQFNGLSGRYGPRVQYDIRDGQPDGRCHCRYGR